MKNDIIKPKVTQQLFTSHQLSWFKIVFTILIILGIFFRLAYIENKIYWHDEVYTSIRASGHLAQEIYQEDFNDRIISIAELQKFQDIKPNSTIVDTLNSLIQEDPQHPPLYFILARYTLKLFGNSLTSHRILAIFFSLLSIPLIYLFAFNLLGSRLVASLSAILISLSPFDVIFAQTDRQYSLLTLTTILSSWMLWRTLSQPTLFNWIFYTLACTLGLYTQPFFGLTIISHFCYILYYSLLVTHNKQFFIQFNLSILGSFILYSPWIYIICTHFDKVLQLTNWVYFEKSSIFLIKLWILNFSSLFTDFFIGIDDWWTYLYRLFFIGLIWVSFHTLYRQVERSRFWFLLILALVPFCVLAIPDLFTDSHRTVVTRYLISCFPPIQITVAFYLAQQLLNTSKLSKLIVLFVVSNGIIFSTLLTFSATSWAKVPSYFNAETAKQINAVPTPLVISDQGDNWTNLGEIISLSYRLKKNAQFYLTGDPPNQEQLAHVLKTSSADFLVFQPSQKLKLSLEQLNYRLDDLFVSGNLYRLSEKSKLE